MRYGDLIQVEYVDMTEPQNQAQFAELLAVVEDRDLPYPLVAINGHLRAAGSAHYYHVLPYIEEVFASMGVEQAV